MAIIGCGHVGSRLSRLLEAAGMRCLLNDPPLAEQGDGRAFVDLDEALQADIISLHVPLTSAGRHATANLIDDKRIRRLRDGALLINTSRGGVVDEQALIRHLRGGLRAAIDVWRDEPSIDADLAALADIATPHIAGYSRLAKWRASAMLRDELCRFIGQETPSPITRPKTRDEPVVLAETGSAALQRACRIACDPISTTGQLREKLATASSVADVFQDARKNYLLRQEFSQIGITCPDAATCDHLARLGFAASR